MNQKFIFGLIVVVIVGVVVGYQLFYKTEPVAQAPAASPSQTSQPTPLPTLVPPVVTIRSLDGTVAGVCPDRVVGSFVAPLSASEYLYQNPVTCAINDRYKLVLKTDKPTSQQLFAAPMHVYLRDSARGIENLVVESLTYSMYGTNSGGLTALFFNLNSKGILDLFTEAGGDTGGGFRHTLVRADLGQKILEYYWGTDRMLPYFHVKKDAKEWSVALITHVGDASEWKRGQEGEKWLGTVTVRGISVNGKIVKPLHITRNIFITDEELMRLGDAFMGPLLLGADFAGKSQFEFASSYPEMPTRQGTVGVDFNDDFSKVLFKANVSVRKGKNEPVAPNNYTNAAYEDINLGEVVIDLK